MEIDNRLSILFVLESAPESGVSLAFLNCYLDSMISILKDEVEISIFYPEFSDKEEHFSLNIVPGPKFKRMITYLPSRQEFFRESFINKRMDGIFDYILKEEHFDCIHIWSLKNHSFNYPFIARERALPVICTIHDGFLFSNCIFNSGLPVKNETVRISNFVNSSVTFLLKKIFLPFNSGAKRSFWFENIGRYSRYYNRATLNTFDSSIIDERTASTEELIKFTDKFLFFSEIEYNSFYMNMIAENKVVFMDQGVLRDGAYENRPFEIEGAVKFGFMGEILPEEGILELVEGFNILYNDGYQNELHIYGELHENRQYFSRLKNKVNNPNVFFHGPIQPDRINAVLNTFDVLVIPSKWHRSDTFLLNNAILGRKAVIVNSRNNIAEKVRKFNRGLVIDQLDQVSISSAVSELERNRKRLYYFMRVTDDFNSPDIEDNVCTLIDIYSKMSIKTKSFDKVLLNRKLHKKKIGRQRG